MIPGVVYVQSQLSDGSIVAGTGMVLTPDGEVLTNYHLVRDEIVLGIFDLGDHRVHSAHVVGGDAADDIAVVQIEGAHNLPTVRLAQRAAFVGEQVVAVGNGGGKLGEHPGRITATGKTLTAQDPEAGPETIHGLLQTDARLTPGDSGGLHWWPRRRPTRTPGRRDGHRWAVPAARRCPDSGGRLRHPDRPGHGRRRPDRGQGVRGPALGPRSPEGAPGRTRAQPDDRIVRIETGSPCRSSAGPQAY